MTAHLMPFSVGQFAGHVGARLQFPFGILLEQGCSYRYIIGISLYYKRLLQVGVLQMLCSEQVFQLFKSSLAVKGPIQGVNL